MIEEYVPMDRRHDDSYPKHKTPICTPEGPPTINVEERRRWRRKEQMKNADLIIFFILYFPVTYSKNSEKSKIFENKILVIYYESINITYSKSNEITDGFVLRFAMIRCM